ncbi:MAG: hypothetical protein ACD_45C00254G0005 [uncultured bacterium]|nr:MAG: hypothetical protein ACD_45C00254G0005 [uncultured bacterium]
MAAPKTQEELNAIQTMLKNILVGLDAASEQVINTITDQFNKTLKQAALTPQEKKNVLESCYAELLKKVDVSNVKNENIIQNAKHKIIEQAAQEHPKIEISKGPKR